MKLSPFETYSLFLALKNHFSKPSYDFFKYNGKTNASFKSFEKRRDRFHFDKLSKKYDALQLKDLFVINLLKNRTWIGDLLEEDAHDNYIQYKKRQQSFSYVFTNEIEKAFAHVSSPRELFKINSNQFPKIVELYLNGEIFIDTFAMLDSFIHFSEKFDKKIGENDIIWSKVKLQSVKILPFLKYDRFKFKLILKQKMEEHNV